jgi:DNA-binding Lrp family transcriptional regulator
MEVPASRLDAVAELVNDYAEVNHNYEREHRFNLWFVVTAANEAHLAAVLADIEAKSGIHVMSLPMLEAYHIDLGFALADARPHRSEADGWVVRPTPVVEPVRRPLSIRDADDLRLVAAIQGGLPLVPRPFAAIAKATGSTESLVCQRLDEWMRDGTIGRFGVVVRHRELGYRANAMVVWNVPDNEVSQWGRCFSRYDFVTLCYQRQRHLPEWDYNLFCMIHGRDRGAVEERVRLLVEQCGVARLPHAVLFSRRRFKQRGARYVSAPSESQFPAREGAAHG